ncbi:MAG: peptidoglycan editing factor PgeF [Nitrospirota bacterium]|nr:peptidoglycan editing factor PgeF [Nitrospirota bacterium]
MTSGVITVPSFATDDDGVEHFFGTRLSSVSVTPGRLTSIHSRHRDRVAKVMISVKQVHGTDVLVVDQPIRQGDSFEGGWDALVTNQPGVMVTVRTADCVPVLIHDPAQRVVAAVHAGWRGAVAGIVPKTVALLVSRFGATADGLRMAIGPSAGPCCYEVDEPVLARLREVFPGWRTVVKPEGARKAYLDLRAFVRRQGLADGLQAERIVTVNTCTICHPDLFFSYRREGVVKSTMVSGIALVPHH